MAQEGRCYTNSFEAKVIADCALAGTPIPNVALTHGDREVDAA
ncbi:hypothetical protein [Pseudomonas sp. ME-P-057]|nr:hypothetical protein [Pseudomonas sp. ME-P-057]